MMQMQRHRNDDKSECLFYQKFGAIKLFVLLNVKKKKIVTVID